jgi:hypothetical protein
LDRLQTQSVFLDWLSIEIEERRSWGALAALMACIDFTEDRRSFEFSLA